jgi:RNA 2',3'-cyclic 3'-phosphodiesterase
MCCADVASAQSVLQDETFMTASSAESMRLFYGLWPDDETRTALMQLQQSMQGRKTPYANLHLTLAFLGQQAAALVPVLEDIMTHLPPLAVTLTINEVGYFTRNRVVWAGMHTLPVTLVSLHEEITHALVQAGVAFNNQRSFKPHITLARDAALPPDITFDPIVWRAGQIALVQSSPNTEGSDYEVLASRSLEKRFWTGNEAEGNASLPR